MIRLPSCATSALPNKAMFRTENALILREVRFRESDRILTALTADAGKMTLAAHGALSKKSKIAAATQLLTYSELTLFEKNGRFAVREGVTKEAFPGLRTDLKRFALGCYFAECLEQFAAEEQPEPELMQLGLNCLYALSEDLRDSEMIKAAFELRLMGIEGYAPNEGTCAVCGRADIQEPVFSPSEGQVVCRACRKTGGGFPLTEASLEAMRHVIQAPAKRMLAFRLSKEDGETLTRVAESWLLRCSERNFPTLTYYKNL